MTMTTDTFHLHYQAWGNPKAQPLLLLHGFLGTGEDWRHIAHILSSDFFCLAPDIPGHGQTLPTQHPLSQEAYTMPRVASTLVQFLDALVVPRLMSQEVLQQKPLLCGYSMGGRLALFLALHFPERFSGACILSGTAGLRTEEERQARQNHDEQLAQRLDTEPFSTFLEFWYNQPLFAPFKHHAAFADILSTRIAASPSEAARSLRGMGTGAQPNCWDDLSRNRLPIQFVTGEKDSKFVAIARELHACTPYSQHRVIPNVGHVLHHEAPEEVIRIIRELNPRKQ